MTALEKDAPERVAPAKPQLPVGVQEKLDALLEACSPEGHPLHLIVLGGFSVGKSTLLNMLIGEQRLHVAREEATSLPTFIEYGTTPNMSLVGADASVLPVDEAGFREATSNAPEGMACATLALPLPWLQGVTLVDLPGLGSVSATRQQYTAAQILQADAVLYLLDPRGPSQPDIDALRLIAQYGKRVKVVVARWDEVLEAQKRGETIPRLETWAADIEAQTGLRVRLTGVSRDGLERDDLLAFVVRARDDLAAIRQRRLQAEMRPLLENALGANHDAQRACAEQSEGAARALHTDLIERKQELLGLKSELYGRQQQDKANAQRMAEQVVAEQRRALERRLEQLAASVDSDQAWDAFQNDGCALLRQGVANAAAALSEQSGRYGALLLPEGQAERCNVRVPPMAVIDTAALIETAKLTALEEAIVEKHAQMALAESKLDLLPAVALDDAEDALHEKLRMRTDVATQALPRMIEVVPGNGASEIGRILGEIADVGLMFVNPGAAGAKVGSLVAKGAKVAKFTVSAKKVASAVKTGVRAVQAVKGGRGSKNIPAPVLDKLGMLEALSLGYWGERIGAAMGGAPSERLVVDPEARAQQAQLLASLDQEIHDSRRELARKQDAFNERQLTGWALEQSKREITRLEQEIDKLAAQREAREQQAFEQAQHEHLRSLNRLATQSVQHWLISYDQQATTMTQLLIAHVTSYWEQEVDAVVGARAGDIEALLEQMRAAPANREAALAVLRTEARALHDCLAALA